MYRLRQRAGASHSHVYFHYLFDSIGEGTPTYVSPEVPPIFSLANNSLPG